jgi:hypothetical protein
MASFDEIKKKSLAFSTGAQKTTACIAREFSRGESRIVVNISLRSDSRLRVWVRIHHKIACFGGIEVLNRLTTDVNVKKCHEQLLGELKEILSGCNFNIIDEYDVDNPTGSYILIERQ